MLFCYHNLTELPFVIMNQPPEPNDQNWLIKRILVRLPDLGIPGGNPVKPCLEPGHLPNFNPRYWILPKQKLNYPHVGLLQGWSSASRPMVKCVRLEQVHVRCPQGLVAYFVYHFLERPDGRWGTLWWWRKGSRSRLWGSGNNGNQLGIIISRVEDAVWWRQDSASQKLHSWCLYVLGTIHVPGCTLGQSMYIILSLSLLLLCIAACN